jgi:hypothetical protein
MSNVEQAAWPRGRHLAPLPFAKPCFALLCALLFLGCSSADFCDPGEPCVGFAYTNYRNVINRECNEACMQLAECNETLARKARFDCEEVCVNEVAQTYYWTCEPRFRSLLTCLAGRNDCNPACEQERSHFDACRNNDLPANANSCVLANNGVCDEPDDCVVGSDTTDCASAQ